MSRQPNPRNSIRELSGRSLDVRRLPGRGHLAGRSLTGVVRHGPRVSHRLRAKCGPGRSTRHSVTSAEREAGRGINRRRGQNHPAHCFRMASDPGLISRAVIARASPCAPVHSAGREPAVGDERASSPTALPVPLASLGGSQGHVPNLFRKRRWCWSRYGAEPGDVAVTERATSRHGLDHPAQPYAD
jgi:hypothetical protein